METHKATITRAENKTVLTFKISGDSLNIVLTEDNPNEVKSVFNKLLLQLKKGKFNFELEDSQQDLYHHISKEYITQLNLELESVYKELEDYDLLNIDQPASLTVNPTT